LYWVILEERLTVRVLASAVDDNNATTCHLWTSWSFLLGMAGV